MKTSLLTTKQRGSSTMDLLIYSAVIISLILFVVTKVPDIVSGLRISSFQSDASTISNAAYRWKKGRSNYATVSLTKICNQDILPKGGSICGAANTGVGTNPYGGNWTVTANSNPGLYNVSATLPNDADTLGELSDAMAPVTRGACQEATGCSTLIAAGTTITMTY